MSTLRMGITLFSFCCLLCVVQARRVFVSAPNTLRLDAEETVAIVTNDILGQDPFNVYLQNLPDRKNKFSEQAVVVRHGLPAITKIKVTQKDLPEINFNDLKKNTYVCLVVTGNGFSKEFNLLVSPRSGYTFIQTDKPIYTPQQTVNIRVLPLNEELIPKNGDVRLQIKNPDDIIVHEKIFTKPWDKLSPGTLFPTYNYKFPPYPKLGEWSVVAQHGHEFQINSTVQFKVDKYVLPNFVVKIYAPNVILPEDPDVEVRVDANYVFGEKVKGTAVFKFGVKHKLGNIIEIGKSKTEKLRDGEAKLVFSTNEITKKIPEFPFDSKLFVEVDILDAATGIREKASNEECIFSHSPFTISFKNTQRDFKAGLISVIMANVRYVNGNPAKGIPTSISVVDATNKLVNVTHPTAISDENGNVRYIINTYIGSPKFIVTVKTNDKRYRANQQFAGKHILNQYKSPGGYIAISRTEGASLLKVGSLFSATVFADPADKFANIFFLILSRGRIVQAGALPKVLLLQRDLQFRITAEMVPSIRIVIYALYNDKLVADSIRVEVEHTCQSQAEVKIETKFREATPGSEGNFVLTGTPDTSVGILAVDSAVYALRDKDRLTRDKFFQSLENDDLGCGPGGGIDTELVLANAGVTIFGNFVYSSKEKNVLGCAERVRRKREAIDTMMTENGIDVKKCCLLGIVRDKYNRTCEERANIVGNFTDESDGGNCTNSFLTCCNNVTFSETDDTGKIFDDRGRLVGVGEEELEHVQDLDAEEKQTSIRKDFRETWLFQDYRIGPDGTKNVGTNLPHSITTWIIQAVSVSRDWGMCVSKPKELVSKKNIFLHLNLPYAVVQNEQIEVRATVFNYNAQRTPVTVYMRGIEDLCTGVAAGEKTEQKKITVEPFSASTVGFPMVPLKAKEYTLRVVALSPIGNDVIEKELRVIPQGAIHEETIPVILDPTNQRRRKARDVVTDVFTDSIDSTKNIQLTAVKLKPTQDFIPGTESCIISAIGDEFGPTIETMLQDPQTLIRLPVGCGEQTMMFMGPTVYTLHYLKVKGEVTPAIEEKVYGYIREGYNRELTFRKNDGSYAAFPTRPSSTWLTAFVMKIFCQASKFVFIDQNVICSGINWLLLQQSADGSFTEKSPVVHRDMMGGINGAVPMTAFVLISLQQCNCEVQGLKFSKLRAQVYLEGSLPNINDPYVLSLVSYALALSDSELKLVSNNRLQSMSTYDEALNQRHWSKGSRSHVIETTAYALLTQVVLEEMQYSLPIVSWLNMQRLAGGVFPSTQDTVIALNALSQYAIKAQSPAINLHCNVTYSSDRKLSKTLEFQNDNAKVLQQFELEKIGGTVFFHTAGSGVGLLSVKLRYNVPRPLDKLCKFDVTVNVTEAKKKIKPAVVKDNVEKNFFKGIPDGLIRALDIEDDHFEFRQQEDIKFDDDWPDMDFNEIDPRIKNQDDDNKMDFNERDRDIDDNVDDRDRVGDENEDNERDRIGAVKAQKANSKPMLQVTICARSLSDKNTDMAIIDAGIFSGFKPELEDLDKLMEGPNSLVDRYEMAGKSIIFYLKSVPIEKRVCLEFRIIREFIVGTVQPTVIKVYDYYNTEEACTIFYSPDSNSPLLRKICEGSVCQCAEGGCPLNEPFIDRPEVQNQIRDYLILEACENHDYVWKGIVESVVKRDGFIHVRFRITKVLKPGAEQKIQIEGFVKTLLLQDICTSLKLLDNEEYLIMGNDGERFEDRETNELVYRYLIDKSTIIHKWELIRDAPDRELQKALNWLQKQLLEGGCRK